MRKFLLFSLLAAGFLSHAQRRAITPANKLNEDMDGMTYSLGAVNADQVDILDQDGIWTLALKVSTPGASGLQLYVENLRLPEGSRLRLRGINPATGEPGDVLTVYEGVGPLLGDPFWTAAVPGSDAVLEVAFAGEAVSDLPFQLSRVRSLNDDGMAKLTALAASPVLARPEMEGQRGFANFRGAVVPFEVRNGLALFENDIILGRAEEIQIVSAKDAKNLRQSQGITSTSSRWPNGLIPYEIDPAMPNPSRITDAIAHWNSKLSGPITLRPRNGEAYYIRYVYTTSAGTCSSYIGNMHMAAQPIMFGDYCTTGNAIHETGHAIGLFHEHTREDRNSFVTINTANLTSGTSANFDQAISTSDDLGTYDYGSIMHYGAYAFSSNGLPTITTIPAGIAIGQRDGLSPGDIAGVRLMYPAVVTSTTVGVTVASNPAGRQLIVDGVSVTAPVTFQWTAGTTHTVSAPTVSSGSSRYLFKSWSDGGAQTHTITTPASAWTNTANFQLQYSLTAASSNTSLGSVKTSPAAADNFFNVGTAVGISATSAASACLTAWTGIVAPPSSPVQVTVNQTYAVTGTFQQGSVTPSPSSFTIPVAGGSGTISVASSGGCAWTATTSGSWITITSGASGIGSGTVGFTVAKRTNNNRRNGYITIGNSTVSIAQ
jgi:astacin